MTGMGGSGWGTPNEGGRVDPNFVIAGYQCPNVPSTLPPTPSQTWQERRAEILELRNKMAKYRMYPIRWGERRPLLIFPDRIRHLWVAKVVGLDRPTPTPEPRPVQSCRARRGISAVAEFGS